MKGKSRGKEVSALRPAVVLVRPREEGNVGAAARAMANMGLRELVLVAPEVEPGVEARAFAVGAREILERARIVGSLPEALEPYRRVVGTTSARGRDDDLPLVTARELPPILASDPPGTSAALLFGCERSGLDNEDLARCGVLVRVPCDAAQPTLNLAQAVLVVSYELACFRGTGAREAASGEPPAAGAEIEALFRQLAPLLERIGLARDDTFDGVLRDLRRLAARSGPSSREVQILRGICRRAGHALARRPR